MKKIKEKIKEHIEKRGKGFTLVELLAVIVILAVVILIAVTAVIPRMNSAKKNAFADEALAYIKAAKEANVEGQMDGNSGSACFTIDYLNQNYIDKKSDEYEGFISYDSSEHVWKAYIKNDKYMINGESGNLSKANVTDAGELTTTPNDCVGMNPSPICKRATTLHTDTCTMGSPDQYCSGDGYKSDGAKGTTTITFGNLGSGSTLATGDAFDCDVNGDGTYDPATERFYYVTDMDSDTAVLIYYHDANDGSTILYNTNNSGYLGPQTAVAQLPTTSDWSNVSLTNTIRDIKDEQGTVRVAGFSYEGHAARLLTYDEVQTGCYDGVTSILEHTSLSTKCLFLFENTKYVSSSYGNYGPWLENVSKNYPSQAWIARGDNRYLIIIDTNAYYRGVRPVIEVPKSSIEL